MNDIQSRIHFLGYSRGANIALETLVRSRDRIKHHPWSNNIKSVVSLGGVLWGAEIADTTLIEGHPNKHALDLLLTCAGALDYSHRGDMGTLNHVRVNSYKM